MVRRRKDFGTVWGWMSAALLCVLSFAAAPAWAIDCSELPNGILDGATGAIPPSQIQVDRNCTIRNYPASNPLNTNFSFLTQPGQTNERWLIIFDNVVHTGQMACNSVAEHKIWFTNGSSTSIQDGCQNLLIPVEKIDKDIPPGPTTATIGVPFTYRLTMPVLFDPATSTVINTAGSVNDLHGVTLTDDLNAIGVDLSYVSHVAYVEGTGTPVAHTFSNVGGVLTFDNFPIIPAGQQIVLELTLVLNDTPVNSIGTSFINTAKWDFGRLIDGVFYEPLPGEWGISPPLTIAGPELTVTKTGPATLNLGQTDAFTLYVQNTGSSDAWHATLLDRLPDGPAAGMCDTAPVIQSAQVFAADGITTVPGKGPLVEGTDYTVSFTGAPTCELTVTVLNDQGVIGPGENLIITYQARLDDNSADGSVLTNIAGAVEWFNGDVTNPNRLNFQRSLTDGTTGAVDHEDSHTVTVALTGFIFEKTVENLDTGDDPATIAAPGNRLRYSLRLLTTDTPLSGVSVVDDLGAMNGVPAFLPSSLTLVPGSLPPGADASGTNSLGGTNSSGLVDVGNLSLPANSELVIQFDVNLHPNLTDGTFVTNQADLISSGNVTLAVSDDPNVNGQANPDLPGDEDPTQVLIQSTPSTPLAKTAGQASATIGETFSYQITVPAAPHPAPLYDVRILDDLSASAADLEFLGVSRVSGPGSWTPVNTGSATSLVIEDTAGGIDIPAGEQIVVEVQVRLTDTATNVAGLSFTNTADYTFNLLDDLPISQRPGLPATSAAMTVVEPDLTLEKSGPQQARTDTPSIYTLNVQNIGGAPAFEAVITDFIPDTPSAGMCDAPPAQITVQRFQADGVTAIGAPLISGVDFDAAFSGMPGCSLTFSMLPAAAAIGPGERLIIGYQTTLDAGSQQDVQLTNLAGATAWSGMTGAAPGVPVRQYAEALTDGTVGILDHEDAHTAIVFAGQLLFEKTVVNLTTGDDPAAIVTPSDRLRYSLRVENVGDVAVNDFSVVDELDRLNGIPAFQSGTLTVVTVPAGGDTGASNPSGGAARTGVVDVSGLSLDLAESLLIEFEVELAPVLANGSFVTNQSQIVRGGFAVLDSDDPLVNGPADPLVFGDEDPTQVQVQSAPYFDVDKVSAYPDGDPAMLMAGERIHYTITVRNLGNDHASDARLRDALPANTTYVSGSTRLNGAVVADAAGGAFPLSAGILINAPENQTPGYLTAVPGATSGNTATVEFEVLVDGTVADGTIISNQGYASAPQGGVADTPSDDPRTPVVDDPTQDVVGNLPLIFAAKSAALQVDGGAPGIVDPGDYLRYTITVYNNGPVPATMVRLSDVAPTDTTYAEDTLTLNGLAVGQPDGGIFPLEAGVWISSTDLTPPLPGPNEGELSPGQSATIQFDVRVNDGVARGTLITNQATVTTEELGTLLTDGDGNPATGPEPTVVVVGDAQQLAISKTVTVVGGGPALAGSTLEYLITVQNISAVPVVDVYVTDNLDDPTAGQLLYVDQSATLNGNSIGIGVAGPVITADYSSQYGVMAPGEAFVVRFLAEIYPQAPIGTRVTNVAEVTWNTDQTAAAEVSVDVGGVPGSGTLGGTFWHDANFDDLADSGERLLEGWTVELRRNGQLVHTTLTDANGAYQITGLVPTYQTTDTYGLSFRAPGAGMDTALLGMAYSADFTNGLQRIDDIEVLSGSNLQNLDLPIDPNGVVYDSIVRTPLRGARLSLINAETSTTLPSVCFDDPAQQGQVTLGDGYYKFDLNFSDPSCPSGGRYVIEAVAPGGGFVAGYSQIIPPAADVTMAPFNVPFCASGPDDAVAATANHCEMQASEFAPSSAISAQSPGIAYHINLLLDGSDTPGSSQLFNNHIPLDPVLDGVVTITKTTPMVNVTRGQMVPYTITVRNSWEIPLTDVDVVDRYPVGFKYIEGSGRVDGQPVEPVWNDGELVWESMTLSAEGQHTIQLLLAPGAGVVEGKYTNRAQAMHAITGDALSGEAGATVRLVPDPTFDCTDVTGKVFDDGNRNGLQDNEEFGIAGARLVTPTGLAALTDNQGRFHITCAITPREGRGSNFMLKLDDRTLPSGYRASTEKFQIKRATRGKALHFSFGASIHRVVGLDIADAVFEPDSTEMRPQWRPRVNMLLEELEKNPAILRLSYLADVEDPKLVKSRVKAMTRMISNAWRERDCCYRLVIEHEVFWRMGKPPEKDRRLAAFREAGQ
jgi:uncharacterized repeat protein (TIGR01451 family)/fimbrial isopeptide formation D2 family protein